MMRVTSPKHPSPTPPLATRFSFMCVLKSIAQHLFSIGLSLFFSICWLGVSAFRSYIRASPALQKPSRNRTRSSWCIIGMLLATEHDDQEKGGEQTECLLGWRYGLHRCIVHLCWCMFLSAGGRQREKPGGKLWLLTKYVDARSSRSIVPAGSLILSS